MEADSELRENWRPTMNVIKASLTTQRVVLLNEDLSLLTTNISYVVRCYPVNAGQWLAGEEYSADKRLSTLLI